MITEAVCRIRAYEMPQSHRVRFSVANTNPFFDFAIVALDVAAPVEFAVASVHPLLADQIVAPTAAHRCAPIAGGASSIAPATHGS